MNSLDPPAVIVPGGVRNAVSSAISTIGRNGGPIIDPTILADRRT